MDLRKKYGISPKEFANAHFKNFKDNGQELTPRFCPYCRGGTHSDRHTFYLSKETGAFLCFRGSCQESGSFKDLLHDFGELEDDTLTDFFQEEKMKKSFKKPKDDGRQLTSKAENYLKKRGFSDGTLEYFDIQMDKDRENIKFPYYDQEGELVFAKYRPPRKIKEGEQKMWREKGAKPILFNLNHLDPEKGPLKLCEGEMDCAALYESGIENVSSVPSGTNDLSFVDYNWDILEEFDTIVIWADNDKAGKKLEANLIRRLGRWRCLVATSPNGENDPNEVLFKQGSETVQEAVNNAEDLIDSLVSLSDITATDVRDIERIRSSIPALNTQVAGYWCGSVSVWTGKNGSGKSTFLGQELAHAVNEGYTVAAYSGELIAPMFRNWINRQVAGPDNLEKRYDPIQDEKVPQVNDKISEQLQDWYGERFFLFDDRVEEATTTKILDTFRLAARRHGARFFVVDNLMSLTFDNDEPDFYLRQATCVQRFVTFAKKFNVAVHLVTHPRKTKGQVQKEDIRGRSDITDQADFAFAIDKITDEDRENRDDLRDTDAVLRIIKNRPLGREGEIRLMFEEESKRFEEYPAEHNFQKKYGWED